MPISDGEQNQVGNRPAILFHGPDLTDIFGQIAAYESCPPGPFCHHSSLAIWRIAAATTATRPANVTEKINTVSAASQTFERDGMKGLSKSAGVFGVGAASEILKIGEDASAEREMPMDFDAYEDWAKEECLFIGGLLEAEGLMEVLRTCLLLGKERVHEIAEEQAQEISEFLHTPRPARTEFLRRIGDTSERQVFLIAALREARCGLLLLENLSTYGVTGSSGISESMILLQSAAVAQSVAAELPPLYPFAEDCPFGMTPKWFFPDA